MFRGSERRDFGCPEAETQLPPPGSQRPLGSSHRHINKELSLWPVL